MALSVTPSGSTCGAFVEGIDLTQDLSADNVAALRALWLEHQVLCFPNQPLGDTHLERFTLNFGAFGDDPYFEHIEGHEHIAAIERRADETTPLFASTYHTDWSFLPVPPAGTILFGMEIPPLGGDTLFANQYMAYDEMPDDLRARVEGLTAIHSAEIAYAPDGAYGEADKASGRSMGIKFDESARVRRSHPFIRTHRETGKKALYSSPAYIVGFEGMDKEESDILLGELYAHQTQDKFIYAQKWQKNMLVMWDNRCLLHCATGGFDGHHRLLHRTTIADTAF